MKLSEKFRESLMRRARLLPQKFPTHVTFFNENGHRFIDLARQGREKQSVRITVEELYQHFRLRLSMELAGKEDPPAPAPDPVDTTIGRLS